MPIFVLICFCTAILAALSAIVIQWRDIVPNYGNTMGSQMLTGSLWVFVSFVCAVGSLSVVSWFFSILIFLMFFAVSLLVRWLVEGFGKRLHQTPSSTEAG